MQSSEHYFHYFCCLIIEGNNMHTTYAIFMGAVGKHLSAKVQTSTPPKDFGHLHPPTGSMMLLIHTDLL